MVCFSWAFAALRGWTSPCGNKMPYLALTAKLLKKKKSLPICLAGLGLSCSMWDLVLQPGIEPGPPALEAQSVNHWTTRETPKLFSKALVPADPSRRNKKCYHSERVSS